MTSRTTKRRWVIGGGFAAILAVFGYLLYGGLDENLVYFLTPQELISRGASVYDAPVRLGGQVEPGSVVWQAEALDLRFRLTDGMKTVDVRSKGAPPQMFRDGIGVVVEGRYRRNGVFESTNLMVKHSNEYRAPAEGQKPEQMYRSLMKDQRT